MKKWSMGCEVGKKVRKVEKVFKESKDLVEVPSAVVSLGTDARSFDKCERV